MPDIVIATKIISIVCGAYNYIWKEVPIGHLCDYWEPFLYCFFLDGAFTIIEKGVRL